MLDKKGVTSTEAKRIANFLKEMVKDIDVQTSTLPIITSVAERGDKQLPLDNNERIDNWDKLLVTKGRYFALSAWLNEGIKLKDSMIQDERYKSFDTDTVEGLLPQVPPPAVPSLTEKDFYEILSIKERAEQLSAESLAAHIGGFIHNFDEIRNIFREYKPTTFKNISPTETVTVINTLLYDKDDMIEKVEELTSQHREANKLVNYYTAKYKEWVANKQREYQMQLDKYVDENREIHQANNALITKARAAFETAKTNRLEELAALKIVIPNDLQPIMDEVLEKLN